MLGGDDKFIGRQRLDWASMMNPGSRQIYLTFPEDSTFREEDVSNYFRYSFFFLICGCRKRSSE
jgi:hypothetical protein